MSSRLRRTVIAIATVAAASCVRSPETVLERLSDARRLSADLRVQFTKNADAGNRAVMADTDESSSAFVREAAEATQAVQKDIDTLRPLLTDLGYSAEVDLLDEFGRRFAEYRTLNDKILSLAIENTNLKAQRLSFGAGQQAADAFREAVDMIRRSAPPKDRWQVEALVESAVAAVREIQVVQAPHIAEASDDVMARMEKQMMAAEASARRALQMLGGVLPAESRPQITAATAALDRFMAVNAEIVVLSRRNSHVRSLALSLGQKRMLTASCEETLAALQDALAKRGFRGTR